MSTQARIAAVLGATPLLEDDETIPAKLAHDLLGVITIIQGFAQLYPSELDRDRQALITRRIVRACRRMTEWVERSLDASAPADALKRQRVALPGFLRELLETHSLRAKQKGIALRLELGAMPPFVQIDPGCVERILGNLLENAITFSRPTTTIILRARVLEDALELAVEDEGPGIPAEEIATLFDAYRTGSARPTGGERSTGLGLAIVKDLVRAHRGVIDVCSQLGRGSTFSIRLPLESELEYPHPIPIVAGR